MLRAIAAHHIASDGPGEPCKLVEQMT
jgi:hypothetical protein